MGWTKVEGNRAPHRSIDYDALLPPGATWDDDPTASPAKPSAIPSNLGFSMLPDIPPELKAILDKENQRVRDDAGIRGPEPSPYTRATNFMAEVSSPLFGGSLGTATTGSRRLANLVMPQNTTELAVMLGTLTPTAAAGLGGQIVRAGSRVGITTGMGALGGALDPEGSALGGGALGLVSQLGGESLTKLTRWFSSNSYLREVAARDAERVGRVIERISPTLANIRTPHDFQRVFVQGLANDAISDAYQAGMADVATRVTGPINSPTLANLMMGNQNVGRTAQTIMPGLNRRPANLPVPFEYAAATIRRLRSQGFVEGEARGSLAGMDARAVARSIQDEVSGELARMHPTLERDFNAVNQAYGLGKNLIRFFDDKALVDKNGLINTQRLQSKLARGSSESKTLARRYALQLEELQDAIFRGAPTLATDQPGTPSRFHFGGHFGVVPYAGYHPGKAPSFVGETGVERLLSAPATTATGVSRAVAPLRRSSMPPTP